MDQDVFVSLPDGSDPKLEQCLSLVCDENRSTARAFSTRVYCGDDWRPVKPSQFQRSDDLLSGARVTQFRVGLNLAQAITREIFGDDVSVSPVSTQLSPGLTEAVCELVSSQLGVGNRLNLRRRLKPIGSNPAMGLTTGGTTDGLHFDAEQPGSVFRVGINLGLAPRFVIFGLTSLGLLRHTLGGGVPNTSVTHAAAYDYARLVDTDLSVVRFVVPTGYGWLMKTERVLHDGRRANTDLPSRFVLLEAEVRRE
jgi:hypothetical protein